VQTHFVLLKEKKGDDYIIYDPYKYGGDAPDKEVLLTKRYKYNGARLETEISAVLWFDCYSNVPAEPPKVTKAPLPAERYMLYAGEDDLALRAEPSTSAYLWKRLVKGTELLSLEPRATARNKVGGTNQWIQVQDPKGDQGYVAAWFVTETNGKSAASVTSAPAQKLPPGALALLPTTDLAFRSEPRQAPETLLRTIPVTEQLVCMEPAKDAIAKVGVQEKWIRVKDASSREGYVAAWLVKYASGSTAQQTATAPTAMSSNGGPLKVRVTAEGTALRKQPIVSDATLIKRMSLGTELIVLDPSEGAKVGMNNQWIRVKDPTGAEGVVAAWFVAR